MFNSFSRSSIWTAVFISGLIGAAVGSFVLRNTNIVLPSLGIVVSGSLFGAVLGFAAGAFIGLIIGLLFSR